MEAQAIPFQQLRGAVHGLLDSSGASVADAVFRILRQAIIRMVLVPGARLTEQELADALSVSRQPVREALLRLREAKLVRVVPRGSFVARISIPDVETAQFVREAIETAIVRRAGAGLALHETELLRDILRRQDVARAAGDAGAFFTLDEEFHRTLAATAGCAPAWATIELVKAHMDRVRYLSLPTATPLERLIAQHRAILDGILERDPEGAALAMQAHLREIVSSLPRLAREHAPLFEQAMNAGN